MFTKRWSEVGRKREPCLVNKVTPAVFARYPDAHAMAEAQLDDLFPMVKSCGFKSKASNIIETCRLLCARHGGEVPATR